MKRATIIRTLWHWHRRIGLVACIILLILSLTGILLNHSPQFGWDRKPISLHWILGSYGFEPPDVYQGIKISDHYWVLSGNQLFFDDEAVASCFHPWHSITSMSDLVVAACFDEVSLFSTDGMLLESVKTLPEPQLLNIGRVENESRLLLEFVNQQYLLDVDSLEIEPASGLTAFQTALVPVPDELAKSLKASYRVADLTWERFLLDLHAGRWFGGWGWLLMDLGGLFLLILSLSGVAMYVLRRTR